MISVSRQLNAREHHQLSYNRKSPLCRKRTNKNNTNNNMKQKILLEAKTMAREAGFHDAKRAGVWKDCEVVEPIFTDDEDHFIGFPQYILCKGGKLRWTKDHEESLDIMDGLK